MGAIWGHMGADDNVLVNIIEHVLFIENGKYLYKYI